MAVIAESLPLPEVTLLGGADGDDNCKAWESFYSLGHGYSDRRYIFNEYQRHFKLDSREDDSLTIIEIGCGFGSTARPLLVLRDV